MAQSTQAVQGFLPPYGHTGVETATAAVAWLGGTIDAGDADASALGFAVAGAIAAAAPLPGSTLVSHGRHYQAGTRADDWSWQVLWSGMGGARGTVYVEARQTLVETSPDVVRAILGFGLRPSRVDLACDAPSDSPSPAQLFALRDEAWTRTRRGGWTLTLRGDGGEKLYVGSRTSERFLRVYVKGERIRHELELKGSLAAAVGASLEMEDTTGTAGSIFAREYAKLVRWPSPQTSHGTASSLDASH